jgi:hypothetical protein
MNVQKITNLAGRLKELGVRGVIVQGATRSYRRYFGLRYEALACARRANHTWQNIVQRFNRDCLFEHFLSTLFSHKSFDKILACKQFAQNFPSTLVNDPALFAYTDALYNNDISILGSPKIKLGSTIPWHCDIKCSRKQWGSEYWNKPPLRFYQRIKIEESSTVEKEYHPDIKVPWELSRLQHLFVLGRAYRRTLIIKDYERASRYSSAFVSHVQSWIANNPYLLGVNWVCPMEVAIRAVNLVWAFHLFKIDKTIPLEFWEKLVCCLYDHFHYLEYNRETSDKPNNHYIADLVGTLYLSVFFKDIKYFDKQRLEVLDEIVRIAQLNIQSDGTNYEGSTHYHKLVTEMFDHVVLLCSVEGLKVPPAFITMLGKMKAFLQDCTDLSGTLTQVGDNDGGKFVTGLVIIPNTQPRLISYRYAGITIMNTQGWHVSYRHPTFNKRQPTGHFHSDELAVTISLDGKPLLIDPGTYLYTGSTVWRNALRHAKAHNTYFVPKFEDTPSELFQMPRQIHIYEPDVAIEKHLVSISDCHFKYANRGVVAHRKLTFDLQQEILEIYDWWQPSIDQQNFFNTKNELDCMWNFHWAPDIHLYQNESHSWIICRKNKPIIHMTSTMIFTCHTDIFSQSYGVREPSFTLSAVHPLSLGYRSIRLHRF